MNIALEKAIEILTRISYGDTLTVKYDIDSAIKLGIEAMKRFKAHSPYPHEYLGGPLPGETKE